MLGINDDPLPWLNPGVGVKRLFKDDGDTEDKITRGVWCEQNVSEEDTALGYIYVLRSLTRDNN